VRQDRDGPSEIIAVGGGTFRLHSMTSICVASVLLVLLDIVAVMGSADVELDTKVHELHKV
jgi:hypothetical protein